MNNDTRVLATKAVEAIDDPRLADEVGAINAAFDTIRIQARDDMLRILTAPAAAEKAIPRTKSADPIQIASFDC